jgi:hypothetical protein
VAHSTGSPPLFPCPFWIATTGLLLFTVRLDTDAELEVTL